MRIKNLKTGLEGEVGDLKIWKKVIEKTADHNNRIYFCKLKERHCDTPMYHNCVYQDVYEVLQ